MSFMSEIKERAKKEKKTIVLPETTDMRVLNASANILKEGTANLILIGDKIEIQKRAGDLDLSAAEYINPLDYEKNPELISSLYELRKDKGMTEWDAKRLIETNVLYFAVMLVKLNIADGMVAGCINSTGDVLRPSLQILKTAKGTKLVSAFFMMEVPNSEFGYNGIFAFGDCGLNQNPTSEELAHIGLVTGESFKALAGSDPTIAYLSYSSKGSSKHDDVDKVVEAVKIAKELAPDVKLDGEFQLDSAIVPEVAQLKAPGSEVAGKANVLVFPNLDAGNIGYKLVERLAKAEAYGPLTQGIAAPVNDLSRGCSSTDIEGVVAITVVQAQMKKGN